LNAKHGGGNHYISIYTLWGDYCHGLNNLKRTKKKQKIIFYFNSIDPIHH